MKVKQLSREVSISRTSNRVSSGPGSLQSISEQALLPSYSFLLLFSWSEPERHTGDGEGWEVAEDGKGHPRRKRKVTLVLSVSAEESKIEK